MSSSRGHWRISMTSANRYMRCFSWSNQYNKPSTSLRTKFSKAPTRIVVAALLLTGAARTMLGDEPKSFRSLTTNQLSCYINELFPIARRLKAVGRAAWILWHGG